MGPRSNLPIQHPGGSVRGKVRGQSLACSVMAAYQSSQRLEDGGSSPLQWPLYEPKSMGYLSEEPTH